MIRVSLLLFLYFVHVYATDIDLTIPDPTELLSQSKILIDHNRTEDIEKIKKKHFRPTSKSRIGYGYSPDFDIWIRIDLNNTTDTALTKILEYTNPLTSYITLYGQKDTTPLLQSGLLADDYRNTVTPAYIISLPAHSSKTFWIKAASYMSTLIVGVRLWSPDTFYAYDKQKQMILSFFFGALFIIIFYHLLIYFDTRDLGHLYYVLFFAFTALYHILYKGIAILYLDKILLKTLISCAPFIIAFPPFFLAMFTKEVLNLKQYPKLNQWLIGYLILFPFLVTVSWYFELNTLRSFFPVLLLIILFAITVGGLLKKNRQAYFVFAGWILFLSNDLLMYLSSLGIYDIYVSFPYYSEVSLILEALLFSFVLSDKVKYPQKIQILTQEKLISQQKEQETRLRNAVAQKTAQLTQSLEEKELLLKELNHRISNSMQTIISFINIQRRKCTEPSAQFLLKEMRQRVMAVSQLYTLLHTDHGIDTANMQDYLSLMIDTIEAQYDEADIMITLDAHLSLPANEAVYCGFIVNEALTNAYKHAFTPDQHARIDVTLKETRGRYILTIQDNGAPSPSDMKQQSSSMGLTIIETLATHQLKGEWSIQHQNGTTLTIQWRKDNEAQHKYSDR